jgi:2-methylisocitrate lyase-like PEP mutase family enzyme
MTTATESSRASWRSLLRDDRPLVLPGAYDALSARLVEQQGFEAFVIGGFPLVGSRYGLPDIGLVGLGEMADGVRDIVSATRLPALVDADHGYGDVKNVTHTVRTYETLGAGALLLEDQVAPKRCGHLAGKAVVPVAEMERRIRAATAARTRTDLFLIARTDARSVHGLDDALRRADRYLAAGADGIFIEAPESIDELTRIGRTFDVPQMCNMLVGGRTPLLSSRDLHQLGFSMIVHGTTLVCRVARALQALLRQIRDDEVAFDPDQFCSLAEFTQLTGMDAWREIENRF